MVVAILAVILAAILNFLVSSRMFACYPPDFHYRGANDAKSTVKKLYHFKQGIPGWHPDYFVFAGITRNWFSDESRFDNNTKLPPFQRGDRH